MSAGTALKAMPMFTIDTATLSNVTYTDVTNGGLPHAISLLHFLNNNTKDILISYDGTTAQDVIEGGVGAYVNFEQAGAPQSWVALLPKGTKIYLKSTSASGVGILYIAGYYQN